MKKGWTITKLIATGSLGVLAFLIFTPSMILFQVIQMPSLFILTSAFLVPTILIPGLFIVDQFGAATIGLTILMIITLPTNFAGPPGFLPRILLGPAVGIPIDILYSLLKRKEKLAALSIGISAILVQEIFYMAMLRVFSIPGWEESLKLLLSPLGLGFVLVHGTVGALIGVWVLKRIKDTAIVRRIQG